MKKKNTVKRKQIFNRKGFTLIELLATIVVLSLVVSLTIYVAIGIIGKAKSKSYQVTIKNIESNAGNYLLENKDSMTFSSIGNVEYQCITVQNLIDYGYLDSSVLKSPVSDKEKVSASNYIYVAKDKTTKAIVTTTYLMNGEYDELCERAMTAVGDINISVLPSDNVWSREKTATITYRLNNANASTVGNYQNNYSYSGVGTPEQNTDTFTQTTAVKEVLLQSNGDLLATITTVSPEEVIAHKLKKISKIDNENPVISYNGGSFANEKITISLNLTDEISGIDVNSYTVDDFNISIGGEKVSSENISLTKKEDKATLEINSVSDENIVVSVDEDAILDKAGNGNEARTFKIAKAGTCALLEYNTNNQTLVTGGVNVEYINNTRKDAGSQDVTAVANEGYIFIDGRSTKSISCSISKATPKIKLSATGGNVLVGSTVTFNEQADVPGKFTVSSSNTNIATVSQKNSNEIDANADNLVTVKGVASGTGVITVSFVPTDEDNYKKPTNKTYSAKVSPVTTTKALTTTKKVTTTGGSGTTPKQTTTTTTALTKNCYCCHCSSNKYSCTNLGAMTAKSCQSNCDTYSWGTDLSGKSCGGTTAISTTTTTPKACTYNTASACQNTANNSCKAGYSGCSTTNSNGCYTFTCNTTTTTGKPKTTTSVTKKTTTTTKAAGYCRCWHRGAVAVYEDVPGPCDQVPAGFDDCSPISVTTTTTTTKKATTTTTTKKPATSGSATTKACTYGTASACTNAAKATCGAIQYNGCTLADSNGCYNFSCMCMTATGCIESAKASCGGSNNYTGCTTADSHGCYNWNCKTTTTTKKATTTTTTKKPATSGSATTTTKKKCTYDTASSCQNVANNSCKAGYTGCSSADSNGCYTFTCKTTTTTKKATTTTKKATTTTKKPATSGSATTTTKKATTTTKKATTTTKKATTTTKKATTTTKKATTTTKKATTTTKKATTTTKKKTTNKTTAKKTTAKKATTKKSSCFLAGTKIMTINGYVNIEKIKVGDLVLTYNEGTGNNEYQRVTNVAFFVPEVNENELYKLRFDDDSTLKVTSSHRFYIRRDGNHLWLPAEEIKVGDSVMYADKTYHRVINTEAHRLTQLVYNITVENAHNFYVGDQEILVHNVVISDLMVDGAWLIKRSK